MALRGAHVLPSGTTLFRFLAGADLGRVAKAQVVNATMLRRAWAMGAGPRPGILTIDPDATYVDTYGKKKEGSRFSYKGEVQMSPLVGVVGSAALGASGSAFCREPTLLRGRSDCPLQNQGLMKEHGRRCDPSCRPKVPVPSP